MVRRLIFPAIVAALLLTIGGQAKAQEPNFSLMLWSLGSAGNVQSERYQLSVFIGVPVSGDLAGGNYVLSPGYPAAVANLRQQSARRPGSLAFSTTSTSETEGVDKVILTVLRFGGLDGQVTVDYRTVNDTATAGSDYVATSGTLTFADGDDSETIVIPLLNDSVAEPDEWFTVVLESPGGGAMLGEASTIDVTILDDDEAIAPPENSPTPTPVPTAQPDTQPVPDAEDQQVFLPSILYGDHPTAAATATLYIINEMDGHLCYEIVGSILGNRCFDPGTYLYGDLTPGIYTWRITSSYCGTAEGERELWPGENQHRFWCSSGSGQNAAQTLPALLESAVE